MKILITRKNILTAEQLKNLEKNKIEVDTIDQKDFVEYQYEQNVENYDILVGGMDLENLNYERFKSLKVIHTISAGYDYLSMEMLRKNNIMLLNASGVYSVPIAEWVVGLILLNYKNFTTFYDNKQHKVWEQTSSLKELTNKKVLVFGTGSIGKEISKRLKPFDCDIDGVNSNGRSVDEFEKCYNLDTAKQVLKEYDILVFALPSNKHTKEYVNTDFLKNLSENVILINVGRGDLVNEADMVDFLKAHQEVKVFLDVTNIEPLPQTSELWTLENSFVTPHNSFASDYYKVRLQNLIFNNLINLKNKKQVINKIEVNE